ncbi:hypothetical protein DFH08DRAFT_907357 [Mycena albidolilacea]|uniref:Uncharacterized protein n=1 Tax=Mycena albidolilacea TaxID=1033008 RepID=A0AAD6YXK9_9AGAR|nr:hypothetical protein DFH08DRAFT_907357 [Mycena albidolilacea]
MFAFRRRRLSPYFHLGGSILASIPPVLFLFKNHDLLLSTERSVRWRDTIVGMYMILLPYRSTSMKLIHMLAGLISCHSPSATVWIVFFSDCWRCPWFSTAQAAKFKLRSIDGVNLHLGFSSPPLRTRGGL